MKKILISVLLISNVAIAADTLPTKMSKLDAKRLDAAIAHLQLIQEQEGALAKQIRDICAEYKFDAADLGKTVGVNFESGEISRATAKK